MTSASGLRLAAMLPQSQTTRSNVALSANGSVATASSVYAGYPLYPSAAIDGDHKGLNFPSSGGAWHSATGTFPQWLQVDFNGSKTLDEIDLYTLQDAYSSPLEPTPTMTFSLYGLTGYEVQYWDGSAWVNVPGGNVSGNNLVWKQLTFTPLTTTKIRVLTNAAADGYSRITEVEAWGTSADTSPNNRPPVANPGGPYAANLGTPIQFNGSASNDPDGRLTSYTWNFGDGAVGTGAFLSHTYAAGGTYTATLTVTDNAGATNSQSTAVTIVGPNQPPVANAGGPYTGMVGTAIQFNGGNSSDPDGSIVSYSWNFGDGTSGTGSTPTYTYGSAGTYNVTLTVTDNRGATASSTASATVTAQDQLATVAPAPTTTNYSLSFDGSNSYVEVPNSPSINITTSLTVEAWIKTNSVSTQQGIVERYNWLNNDDGGFALRLTPGGKVLFSTIRNSNNYDFVVGKTTVTVGEWHHVAGVFDGNELKVYLDGVLDAAKDSAIYPAAGTKSLKIGARGDDASNTFNGLIDEVRLSEGVRYSADFIPEQRLTPGGLVKPLGVWNFDNQTVNDSSGNNNHGVIIGNCTFSTETSHYQGNFSNNLVANGGTQVHINFDELTTNPPTDVSNHYPNIKFSSLPGYSVYSYAYHTTPQDNEPASSSPNAITRGNFYGNDHKADLTITFPQAVNDLEFYINASDDLGVIASVTIYQGSASYSFPVWGTGASHAPIQFIVGYQNVTKVLVSNIIDHKGLLFDDFKFTVPTPPPSAPTITSASLNNGAISVNWTSSSGAKSYNVKRSTTSGGPYSVIARGISGTNFNDRNGLTKGQTYYYVVSANNDAGESSNSNQASVLLPLDPPPNLTATVNNQQVLLSWSSLADATGYNIKRSTTSGSGFVTIAAGLSRDRTSFIDTDVQNKTYYYVISAIYGGQESADSSPVSASILGCANEYADRPPKEHISQATWDFDAEVSDRDGLVVSDVSLNGRYMAKMMSVPYFYLKTNKMSSPQRGELTPWSDSQTMRTRLRSYHKEVRRTPDLQHVTAVTITAKYVVDSFSASSQSCLFITQEYTFYEKSRGCEPSSTLTCSRFYPKVSYQFNGRGGEVLESINIPQRNHFKVDNTNGNSVGLFRDCDNLASLNPAGAPVGPPVTILPFCLPNGLAFDRKENPVLTEFSTRIIENGKNEKQWDNFHQTWQHRVLEPLDKVINFAGCPECVHTHWRWAAFLAYLDKLPVIGIGYYGGGTLLIQDTNPIAAPTNQDVDIAVVRYKDDPNEIHPPTDYTALIERPAESLHAPDGKPLDVVFWYSATGHQVSDGFFRHGSFFNWDTPNVPRPASIKTGQTSDSQSSSLLSSQDGPTSVVYGHLYEDGNTTFTEIGPTEIGQLPAGYTALNNKGYSIGTEAVVSGPHVVSFNVSSVTDQTTFNKLRILHAEADPLDPEGTVWVDSTILSPDPQAPDFANKTIRAKVDNLGSFVIAILPQPSPPNTTVVDLAVTTNDSSDPVIADNNLTYSLSVHNNSSQTATGVQLRNGLSPDVDFISASSSQGVCKFEDGSVYCQIGELAGGGTASITIVVKPNGGDLHFPVGGKPINNIAFVKSKENDTNTSNNTSIEETKILPNPNIAPSVSITSPTTGTAYVAPANVTITANASDADGISKVEFYDNNVLAGNGTAAGNLYSITLNNRSIGDHLLVAVATDNLGKQSVSNSVGIVVKGDATVNILKPDANAVLTPDSNITVTAYANKPTGTINRVDFYADGFLIGAGTYTQGNYQVVWNSVPSGTHVLNAVATDNSGATTPSAAIFVRVTKPPTVAISSPVNGASFQSSANVILSASSDDDDGPISKMDFYANGVPIGSGIEEGSGQFNYVWPNAPDGIYTLTAVATDQYGVTATANSVTIAVNKATPSPGEFVWFDDSIPQGASAHNEFDDNWYWVDANPAPILGGKAHQSKIGTGVRSHFFDGATDKLTINAGDKLFTYVFLDPENVPRELMLHWLAEDGWEHRAYWGANTISNYGTDQTNSRRRIGDLPMAGRWVRLEVSASDIGLEGKTLSGMTFMLDGGRATWDRAGKLVPSLLPPPPTVIGIGDFFADDSVPAGATTGKTNDDWNWVSTNPTPYSAHLAHQTNVTTVPPSDDALRFHEHHFMGMQTPLEVNPGDVLYTYVYVDSTNTPDELMLQWYDGTSWEHRAYWGGNWIDLGVTGTESRRSMGSMPPTGGWVPLEVPASYVGMEGKKITGMSFGLYSKGKALVTWDVAGKNQPWHPTEPTALKATVPFWRLHGTNGGGYYYYSTNDIGRADQQAQGIECNIYANQAAGTVPLFRFRKKDPNNSSEYLDKYFYTRNPAEASTTDWGDKTIAGYVYPDSVAGTIPLYRFRIDQGYFYTTNESEGRGMPHNQEDGIACYVIAPQPLKSLAAPTNLTISLIDSGLLTWDDNSSNETGFKIEQASSSGAGFPIHWRQIGMASANQRSFVLDGIGTDQYYRVRATNDAGNSAYSNVCFTLPTPDWIMTYNQSGNVPPIVSIASPENGAVVGSKVMIKANASNAHGNGTIEKVEFFEGNNKIGEATASPYVFIWDNVPPGTHTITARITDNRRDETVTSNPITITAYVFR